jgi:hypothetical protein
MKHLRVFTTKKRTETVANYDTNRKSLLQSNGRLRKRINLKAPY